MTDIFGLAHGEGTPEAEEAREKDLASYHREKTRENRAMWDSLTIKQFSVTAPSGYSDLLKASAHQLTAVYLLERINAGDEVVIDTLGNIRPKPRVTIDMALGLAAKSEAGTRVEELLRASRAQRAYGMSADTHPNDVMRHLAREYATLRYAQGVYDMAIAKAATGLHLHDDLEFDLAGFDVL